MQTLFVLLNITYILSALAIHLLLNVDDGIKTLLYVIAFLMFKVLENLLEEITREKNKTIKVSKRFTHKNDDTGAIEVRKEDFQEAILYLYELENQIALKR